MAATRSAEAARCTGPTASWRLLEVVVICAASSFPLAAQQTHPHGDLRVPCEDCHTAEAWTPIRAELGFEHATTGFGLQGAHADAECAGCHRSLEFTRVATACADCHGDAHQGELGFECETCHTPHDWDNRQRLFESHGATLFPLLGTHATQDCASCHAGQRPFEFATTPTECVGCHLQDYQETTDPNHAAAGFPADCVLCHAPLAPTWDTAAFDHDAAFPLVGAHRRVECAGCHATAYAGTPTDCASCHRDDYAAARDPDHDAAGFPLECTLCHSNDTWSSGAFDHGATRFALTGAHVDAQCASCHADRFLGTTMECFGCHEAQYRSTAEPDHEAADFPRACEQCHVTSSWATEQFDHDTTGFVLTGAHVDAECASCHADGYAGTSSECFACHQADYQGTDDPDHEAAGLPRECEQCHRTRNWATRGFDHEATGFALTGAHRDAQCASCHADGYAGTSSECFACHEEDYRGTRDPDHAAAGYPRTCQQCHQTDGWATQAFDHGTTGFALTGAHVDAECASCHADGYAGTSSECFACHEADYRGTRDPDHAAAGYPRACQQCHQTDGWATQAFDHGTTGFALTGAHVDAECASCHADGYAGTPTECFACHESDYRGTREPDHVAAGFARACQECHRTSSWATDDFDHDSTGFRLTGAHVDAECASCHSDGYDGTPSDCYACHQSDSTGAVPDHRGFPTTCAQCHSTSGWSGADFDHRTTGFTLTGAHVDAECASCHSSGYAGTPTDCYACHQSDYAGAVPDHRGFPTTCAQCHSTSGWSGADFDHRTTGFTLTGAHVDAECASCHSSGYAGTPTDCYACHQSDYTGAVPDHRGFPTTCAQCHSTSGWSGADFDHRTTGFTLTGAHVDAECASCHSSGYAGTPTDCYACHQSDYTGAVPDHRGFPTTCAQCHSTSGWSGADFDHRTTGFTLTGAHADAECASCHSSGYAGTPTDCYACHQNDYAGTRDPDHQSAGFPTTCRDCHDTDDWEGAVFDHDSFFPIDSGKHRGKWATCSDCHVSTASFSVVECTGCHEHEPTRMDDKHREVNGYAADGRSCLRCHPDGDE